MGYFQDIWMPQGSSMQLCQLLECDLMRQLIEAIQGIRLHVLRMVVLHFRQRPQCQCCFPILHFQAEMIFLAVNVVFIFPIVICNSSALLLL